MADLPVPANGRVIRECIYCGSTEGLTKEHAVPYGLNGSWTLLDASCSVCAGITHRFERDTLKGLFPAVRTVLAMQTRRPKERPKTVPLVLETAGVQRTIHVAPTEFPLYLPTIEFPPPGVVEGRPRGRGIRTPVLDLRHVCGPSFADVATRYPDADFVGARVRFTAEDFGRTLAKIGYCAAVFALGVTPFRDSPIRRVILGEDEDVWHWVGSWTGEEQNPRQGLHRMKVTAAATDIHVILRLFAQFGARNTTWRLVQRHQIFVNSPDWPWRERSRDIRLPSGHRSNSASEAVSTNEPMWLVIDTNQSRRIPPVLNRDRLAGKAEGLSLPPYMMAELLPRGQTPRSETLAAFAAHQVRIGVEPSMAIEAAAQLGAEDLPAFWPLPGSWR